MQKVYLKDVKPELINEWDFDKNTYDWNTVLVGLRDTVHWICSKKHTWKARPFTRIGKRSSKCPYCTHRKISTEDSFGTLYPELLKEWDYEKNKNLDPFKIAPKGSRRVYWKCKYGHSWPTRVAHRVNGSGCRYCKGQSSKQEVFIFCEVKHFFPEAIFRHRIKNTECDIYLPRENIAIEFDGVLWHKQVEKDAAKVRKLQGLGITIISIRELSHPVINDLTVTYNRNSADLEITKGLMAFLGNMLNRPGLIDYSKGNKQVNNIEYAKEMKRFPNSLLRTLATQNPELSKEWDYSANNGLTPNDYSPFSHHIASWICPNGHPYDAAISTRNRNKTGCARCINHSSLIHARNKIDNFVHKPRKSRRKSSVETRKLVKAFNIGMQQKLI